MTDVALIHKKLVDKLLRYQNGEVSETMTRMGLVYPVNYGLSVVQIDKIAQETGKNNELAIYLWQQEERESKLLSLRIADTESIDYMLVSLLIKGILNIELAEQAALHLFIRLKNKFDIATELLKQKNKFAKLSGYILVSKLVHESKNDNDYIYLLNEIFKDLPSDNAIYLRRGLAGALLKIGLRNDYLKTKVLQQIESLAENEPSLSKYLEQEVNQFLLITN